MRGASTTMVCLWLFALAATARAGPERWQQPRRASDKHCSRPKCRPGALDRRCVRDGEGPFFPCPVPSAGVQPPWAPHLRAGLEPKGRGLIDLSLWPPELPSPRPVDPVTLARALSQLCTRPVAQRFLDRMAGWITQYSTELDVDPFLLAALIQDQSSFRPRKHTRHGVGLVSIQPAMHAARIHEGQYRYRVLVDGRWAGRQLPLARFAFNVATLREPEASVYFGAVLLRVAREQCPAIDPYFRSVPHRHFISHVVWGDRVGGAGVEDRILRERRRLIGYYFGVPPFPRGRFRSVLLYSPLDGSPRKVTSGLGDDRDGGRRRHTGIDFESSGGEPVRAVAAGRVILAGVDWGKNQLRSVDPEVGRLIPPISMGPRGLLVQLQHGDGLQSTYMHLSAYTVRAGQRVKGGQLLGYVGRTGIRASSAHLHFDLRHDGRFIDPMSFLGPYVIPPDASYLGRRKAVVQRQRRMLRWQARRHSLLRRLRDRRSGIHPGHRRR